MFYRTDTDEARLRNAYLKKLKNKEPSLFNEESTQLKRTETKQPFHFRHYDIIWRYTEEETDGADEKLLSCPSLVHYMILTAYVSETDSCQSLTLLLRLRSKKH